jgi:branched-chain amino acid transport system ATP-binding protein
LASRSRPSETPLLETRRLDAFYGDFQALFGIDVRVGSGETVALIGANGAGKSTLLRSITGLLPADREAICFEGRPVGGLATHEIVRLGVAMVPEGRRLFPSLSVEENLKVGAYGGRRGGWQLDRVLELFPVLAERRQSPANALSGGEQQMAAIGRALMANPRLLLCDELSLGLAPMVIRDIYATLRDVTRAGTTVMVVEQDINQAFAVADRLYCLQEGRVSLHARPSELTRAEIAQAYFGL